MSVQSPAPCVDTTAIDQPVQAVASAAADRLRAVTNQNAQRAADAQQALIAATSSAMAAGVSLAQIAAAEQTGHARVRDELGKELLRGVERAHKRRTDLERDEQNAICRAARLGLPHRDIAKAADMAPGTIRAIIARPANGTDPTTSAQTDDHT